MRPVIAPALILERHVLELITQWAGHTEPITMTRQGCRVKVTVIIEPDYSIPNVGTLPPGPAPLTECQRDIMDVLKSSERPLTRPRIIDALESQQMIHGESTIARALSALVKAGLIHSDPEHRQGYSVVQQCS